MDGVQVINALRDGVLLAIGQIPLLGNVLRVFVELFWGTSSDPRAIWRSIAHYAEAMVNQKISENDVATLNEHMVGFTQAAQSYQNLKPGSDKAATLSTIIITMTEVEREFTSDRDYLLKGPVFVAFGTLMLSLMAEQCFRYKDVAGVEDENAAQHLKDFEDALQRAEAAAQSLFDKARHWRFSLLEVVKHPGDRSQSTVWVMTDHYNGFELQRTEDDGKAIWEDFAEQVERINQDFVAKLQDLFAVTQAWRYFDPRLPRPTKIPPIVPIEERRDAPVVQWDHVYLQAGDGRYVTRFTEEYSGTAAANEYFPRAGKKPISLRLSSQFKSYNDEKLKNRHQTYLITNEEGVGDYNYLSMYTSDYLYYYEFQRNTYGSQYWYVLKMIPTVREEIMYDETVYITDGSHYIVLNDDNYLCRDWRPFPWVFRRPS